VYPIANLNMTRCDLIFETFGRFNYMYIHVYRSSHFYLHVLSI